MHSLVKPGPVSKNTVARIIRLADSWEHSDYFKLKYPDKKKFILEAVRYKRTAAFSASTYKEAAFADILKLVTALIFNIDDYKLLWDEVFKNSPNTLNIKSKDGHVYSYREFLQLLGTEVGRNIDPYLWIKATFNSLEENGKYIITDVRFINEAEECIKNGAVLIRINRNVPQMNHSSETSMDEFTNYNHIIDNNGSIEDLIDKVLQLNII